MVVYIVKINLFPLDDDEKGLVNRVFRTEKAAREAIQSVKPRALRYKSIHVRCTSQYAQSLESCVQILQITLEGNELENGGVFFEEKAIP